MSVKPQPQFIDKRWFVVSSRDLNEVYPDRGPSVRQEAQDAVTDQRRPCDRRDLLSDVSLAGLHGDCVLCRHFQRTGQGESALIDLRISFTIYQSVFLCQAPIDNKSHLMTLSKWSWSIFNSGRKNSNIMKDFSSEPKSDIFRLLLWSS